jgi:hypothetical protein
MSASLARSLPPLAGGLDGQGETLSGFHLDKTTLAQQFVLMKMIATRELAANSGRVMKELDKEGVLVITKDGKPRSILLTTSDATLMEDLRDCLYSRARRDLMKAQMASAEAGCAGLSMDEIDAEIRAARATRKS